MSKFSALLDRLAATATTVPENCLSEDCIIRWAVHETQVIQSIYDSALDGGLDDDEMTKIEELYQYKLEEVISIALASLGAKDV